MREFLSASNTRSFAWPYWSPPAVALDALVGIDEIRLFRERHPGKAVVGRVADYNDDLAASLYHLCGVIFSLVLRKVKLPLWRPPPNP